MLFEDYFEEPDGVVMQPVILTVLIVSTNHIDKTIIQPGKGIYIKEQDKDLPGSLLAAANKSGNEVIP